MKRILALMTVIMMLFTFTACDNNSETDSASNVTTKSGNSQQSQNSSKKETEAQRQSDITTLDGWLSYWGLTEDDFKCANYTRLDKTSFNTETLDIVSVGSYVDKKLTEEEVREWLKKILEKLQKISKEGKLVNKLDNNAEITVDYIIDKGKSYLYLISGSFTYNDKDTTALIAVYPSQLDDSDPNEAMPACTLELSH